MAIHYVQPHPHQLCPGEDVLYDEPIILATMGQGFPIFRYPTYMVQTILPSKAPLYTRQEVLILHNKYPGQAWVNQALVNERDNGL